MDKISENRPSFFNKVLAGGLGWAAYTGARYSIYAIPCNVQQYSTQHSPADIEQSLKTVIKNYDLNCDIIDINSENIISCLKKSDEFKKNAARPVRPIRKFLSQMLFFMPNTSGEKIIEIIGKNPADRSMYEKLLLKLNHIYQISLGNDASGGRAVVVNKEKNGLMGFHELGHVYHYKQGNKFIKFLLKARAKCHPFIVLPLGLNIAANSTEILSEKQKQKIRYLTPIAGMLLFLPNFTEEIMASIDGNKFAKEVCSKLMYQNVRNTNRFSMTVKIAQLLTVGAGIALAGIIPHKILKNQNKH